MMNKPLNTRVGGGMPHTPRQLLEDGSLRLRLGYRPADPLRCVPFNTTSDGCAFALRSCTGKVGGFSLTGRNYTGVAVATKKTKR